MHQTRSWRASIKLSDFYGTINSKQLTSNTSIYFFNYTRHTAKPDT